VGLAREDFRAGRAVEPLQGAGFDVHRKIANLGEKTFHWEAPGESYEVKFNYTLKHTGDTFAADLRGTGAPAGLLDLLKRRMKYDRLGVNDALLQFENDMMKGVLPSPSGHCRCLTRSRGIRAFWKSRDSGREPWRNA